MREIMRLHLLLLAACLLSAPAFGEDRQFKNGEAVTIQPDKAYLMARTFEVKGKALSGTLRIMPILVRVLNEDELQQAEKARQDDPKEWKDKLESNITEMLAAEPYAQANGEVTLVTAVKPGTYVLAAVAYKGWALVETGLMNTSLCMGTVKFEAKAGTLTDLGEILVAFDDAPTTIPELANVVAGKSTPAPYTFAVAIRPAGANTTIPASLDSLPRVNADYRAMPAFPNFAGAMLSRLAPVPDVLDYDKDGEVVDLKLSPLSAEAKADASQTDAIPPGNQ
jgi:hypothetical protein